MFFSISIDYYLHFLYLGYRILLEVYWTMKSYARKNYFFGGCRRLTIQVGVCADDDGAAADGTFAPQLTTTTLMMKKSTGKYLCCGSIYVGFRFASCSTFYRHHQLPQHNRWCWAPHPLHPIHNHVNGGWVEWVAGLLSK